MQDPKSYSDAEFDALIRNALECDIDEATLSQNIRSDRQEGQSTGWLFGSLQMIVVGSPLRAAALCLASAFFLGVALPQPEVRDHEEAWINLALGLGGLPAPPLDSGLAGQREVN